MTINLHDIVTDPIRTLPYGIVVSTNPVVVHWLEKYYGGKNFKDEYTETDYSQTDYLEPTKFHKTLYAKSKTGKVKVWSIWTEVDKVHTSSGIVGGKMRQNEPTIAKPKNIGKKNETSGPEQALMDALSKFKKKLDEGYKLSVEDVTDVKEDSEGFIKPMLASKDLTKIEFPCYVQPKLDGVRCLAFVTKDGVKLRSRSGKAFNVDHIRVDIEDIGLKVGAILDGEIYAHGMEFQDMMSLVKNPAKDQTKLQYWVYDTVIEGEFNLRARKVREFLLDFDVDDSPVKVCPTFLVRTQFSLDRNHQAFLKYGYEGTMVRNLNGLYEASYRSKDLIKIKEFFDEEYKIVGGKKGKGKFANCCIFVLETKEGKIFNCTAPGTIEQKEQALKDLSNLIDKMLTVKYQEKSKDNIPRFPVGVAIRDYE